MKADHSSYVAYFIRRRLEEFEEENHQGDTPEDPDTDNSHDLASPEDEEQSSLLFGHVYFGSKQLPESLEGIEGAHNDDQAFLRFRIKLSSFLTQFFQAQNIALPENRRMALAKDTMVYCLRFTGMLITFEFNTVRSLNISL